MKILFYFLSSFIVFVKKYPIKIIFLAVGYLIGSLLSKIVDWMPIIGGVLGFCITLIMVLIGWIFGQDIMEKITNKRRRIYDK